LKSVEFVIIAQLIKILCLVGGGVVCIEVGSCTGPWQPLIERKLLSFLLALLLLAYDRTVATEDALFYLGV